MSSSSSSILFWNNLGRTGIISPLNVWYNFHILKIKTSKVKVLIISNSIVDFRQYRFFFFLNFVIRLLILLLYFSLIFCRICNDALHLFLLLIIYAFFISFLMTLLEIYPFVHIFFKVFKVIDFSKMIILFSAIAFGFYFYYFFASTYLGWKQFSFSSFLREGHWLWTFLIF